MSAGAKMLVDANIVGGEVTIPGEVTIDTTTPLDVLIDDSTPIDVNIETVDAAAEFLTKPKSGEVWGTKPVEGAVLSGVATHIDTVDSAVSVDMRGYRGGMIRGVTGTFGPLTVYSSIDNTNFAKHVTHARNADGTFSNTPVDVKIPLAASPQIHADIPPECYGANYLKFVGFTGTIDVLRKS